MKDLDSGCGAADGLPKLQGRTFDEIPNMMAGFCRLLDRGFSGVRRCVSVLWILEARIRGVQFQGSVVFSGRPVISVAPDSTLVLGDKVRVNSALRSNPLGCFQPSVLRTLVPGARLILATGVGLSGAVICAGLSIEVGEGTQIGGGAVIIDNDFHEYVGPGWRTEMRLGARPVKIGREVFIGTRAIILKGVQVGDRAVIGAGAVVSKDVAADHIAVGNPAVAFPNRRLTQITTKVPEEAAGG